jgi:cytochrome P450
MISVSETSLRGEAAPSPAGPLEPSEAHALPEPPAIMQAPFLQTLRFRQVDFLFRARRELGDVFRSHATSPVPEVVITSHPDHVRSILTAKEQHLVPIGSPEVRPIVGPNSILCTSSEEHIHRRKALLPKFHGRALEKFMEAATAITEREMMRWPVGTSFALFPRMRAIMLDVILAQMFGADAASHRRAPARRLGQVIKQLVNSYHSTPVKLSRFLAREQTHDAGLLRLILPILDRPVYSLIAQRREDETERDDILSLLMRYQDHRGEPLSDEAVRDEVVTLILASYETTATTLAWVWERLVHNMDAYDALRDVVRGGSGPEDWVEAIIFEGMRCRPVIGGATRQVKVPWRLGPFMIPVGTKLELNAILVHHREDLYPEPFEFRPDRWTGSKPGRYDWISFGGGSRRCLGAALALVQQKLVVTMMARLLDLEAADPAPEHASRLHSTLVPARGARVIIRSRHA